MSDAALAPVVLSSTKKKIGYNNINFGKVVVTVVSMLFCICYFAIFLDFNFYWYFISCILLNFSLPCFLYCSYFWANLSLMFFIRDVLIKVCVFKNSGLASFGKPLYFLPRLDWLKMQLAGLDQLNRYRNINGLSKYLFIN